MAWQLTSMHASLELMDTLLDITWEWCARLLRCPLEVRTEIRSRMGLPSSPGVVIVAGFYPLYLSPMLRSGTSDASTDLGAALSLIAAESLSASRPARGAEAATAIPAAASSNEAQEGAAPTDGVSGSGETAEEPEFSE